MLKQQRKRFGNPIECCGYVRASEASCLQEATKPKRHAKKITSLTFQGPLFAQFYLFFLFVSVAAFKRSCSSFHERSGRSFTMKFGAVAAACLSLLSHVVADADTNVAASSKSRIALPSTFKPPQVFQNENLVHIISLEKNYAKETINVVIKNISPEPQDEYYLPFTGSQMEKSGGFEVKDKKDDAVSGFTVDAVEFDTYRYG